MQTKFSKISNILLKYFLVFSVCFLWLNYIRVNNFTAIAISIAVSLAIGCFIRLLDNQKTKRQKITAEEKNKIENISLQFLFGTQKQVLNFFCLTFKANYTIKKYNNSITLNEYNFFPLYNTEEITQYDVLSTAKQADNNIVIACISANPDAIKIANKTSKKIVILTQVEMYKILKKYNTFPDFKITKTTKKKLTITDIKNSAFAKANAKGYLISSIIVLVSSFFVRFNIYYTIFSTALLILSAICLFAPKPHTSHFEL